MSYLPKLSIKITNSDSNTHKLKFDEMAHTQKLKQSNIYIYSTMNRSPSQTSTKNVKMATLQKKNYKKITSQQTLFKISIPQQPFNTYKIRFYKIGVVKNSTLQLQSTYEEKFKQQTAIISKKIYIQKQNINIHRHILSSILQYLLVLCKNK